MLLCIKGHKKANKNLLIILGDSRLSFTHGCISDVGCWRRYYMLVDDIISMGVAKAISTRESKLRYW